LTEHSVYATITKARVRPRRRCALAYGRLALGLLWFGLLWFGLLRCGRQGLGLLRFGRRGSLSQHAGVRAQLLADFRARGPMRVAGR